MISFQASELTLRQLAISTLVDLGRVEDAFDQVERAKSRRFLWQLPGPNQPINFSQVKSLISREPRVVLVQYFTTGQEIYIFGVRADSDSPQVQVISVSWPEIVNLFTTFSLETDITQLEYMIHSLAVLIEPLSVWTKPGDIIWFVPHGMLHNLPFQALKIEGRYLIERNPIVYSPSASIMKYCQAKRSIRSGDNASIIIGDPRDVLPDARQEASSLAALMPNSELLLGSAATKANLLTVLASNPRTNFVHFATLSYTDPVDVLQSGLYLADTTLTVEDIFSLELPTNLVSLTEPASEVKEEQAGDELIGLTQALIYAGTPSVLTNLWSTTDFSTTLLMERFYYNMLAQGLSKVEALQQAHVWLQQLTAAEVTQIMDTEQTTTKRYRLAYFLNLDPESRPFNHPFYWAPFTLTGDWL